MQRRHLPLLAILLIAPILRGLVRILVRGTHAKVDYLLGSIGAPAWLRCLLWLLIILFTLKWGLVLALPKRMKFVDATAEASGWPDREKLETLTSQLEKLGFNRTGDYRVSAGAPSRVGSFGRLFINTEEACFGEITCLSIRGTILAPWCDFTSLMTDGWSLQTSSMRRGHISRLYAACSWLLRRPKAAWSRCGNVSPRDLLRMHVEQRNSLMALHGLNLIPNLSTQMYFDDESCKPAEKRKALKKRSMFAIPIELILISLRPRSEWNG